jgi:hypothetical protein
MFMAALVTVASARLVWAEEPELPSVGLASLGMQYGVVGGGEARGEPWLYPTMALQWSGGWWMLEWRSPLPAVALDGFVGGLKYLIDGKDFSLPILDGLNGAREHVRIPAFTVDARLAPLRRGRHKLDFGLHGALVGTHLQVHGVRRNAHFINAGPAIGYGMLDEHGRTVAISVSAGNGFGHRATVNPYLEGSAFGWLRVVGPAGLYARGQLGVQWIDYRPAASDSEVAIDVIDPVAHGSFELGLAIEL